MATVGDELNGYFINPSRENLRLTESSRRFSADLHYTLRSLLAFCLFIMLTE